AASALELESDKGSEKDAAQDQFARGRAEEGVKGVALGGGVVARPVVESGGRDAESFGQVALGGRVGIGEAVEGVDDVRARPTERGLAREISAGRLMSRHGSF